MSRPPEIDPGLLGLLVCPVTKGPLEYDREAGELISRGAGLAFPIRDGIPIMLIDEARPLDRPAQAHWPTELAYSREDRVLRVVFNDGAEFLLPAELLRVESPSAEVQGHGPEGKRIVAGRAGVAIAEIIPEGNYAVRLVFDDGHDTGIYSWTCLREFGERKDALWAAYLEALRNAGLSR